MNEATRVVRAGIPEPSQGHPFLPARRSPPRSTSRATRRAPYTSGRFHNPTWTLFEKALGELEGGEAVVLVKDAERVAARAL